MLTVSPRADVQRYQPREPQNGYLYVYVVNNDTAYTYTETTNYTTFTGLTLVDNHSGRDGCFVYERSYKLKVAPGKKKLIILEVAAGGFSMAASKSASLQK